MESTQNIPKSKQYSILAIIAFMLCIFINPLTVYADTVTDIGNRVANAYVNSTSSSTTGGTSTIQNGVSYTRTGYLCYLITKDGARIPEYEARALKSPGYNGIPGAVWKCESRRGHIVSSWYESATAANYWGCTPWAEGGSPSNERVIRNWMVSKTIDPKVPNALAFVSEVWGNTAATSFGEDKYVLVIETILSLQFSASGSTTPVTTLTPKQQAQIEKECVNEVKLWITGLTAKEVYNEYKGLTMWEPSDDSTARMYLIQVYAKQALSVANIKIQELLTELAESQSTEANGRVYYGDPVIGTASNLIQYDVWNTTVFDSYLNRVAPHSEKIAKSEAGFTAYSGGSGTLSNDDVHNFGVAMMLIHCNDTGSPLTTSSQTTYDEPQGDTPSKAADESDGSVTIIKSYREKNTSTGTTTDKGTYYRSNLSNQIAIEDEPTYKVIGWKVSTQGNTSISSLTWETSIPGLITNSGTKPTTVNTGTGTRYLYVLLEKTIGTPSPSPAPANGNYVITQSTISRHVNLNTYDNPTVSGTTIKTLAPHTFTWTIPAIKDSCVTTHYCTREEICDNDKYKPCNCNYCGNCGTNHNGMAHSEF